MRLIRFTTPAHGEVAINPSTVDIIRPRSDTVTQLLFGGEEVRVAMPYEEVCGLLEAVGPFELAGGFEAVVPEPEKG